MSSEQNNYKLLFSIISQMSVQGHLRNIDWQLVANDLGLARGAAANLRWTRFRHATGLRLPNQRGGGGRVATTKATGGTKANGVKKAGAGKGKGKTTASKKGKKGEGEDEAYAGDEGSGIVGSQGEAEQEEMYEVKQENGVGEAEQDQFYEAQEDAATLGPEYEEMYEATDDGQEELSCGYGGEVQGYEIEGEFYGDDGYGDGVEA